MPANLDDAQRLKLLHGRQRNNLSEVYKLPADLAEMDKLLVGGTYPPDLTETVGELLKPANGTEPRILDVGSGSGIWTVEMAQTYPSADVVGFDLVKNEAIDPPPNCSFIIGDLTGGLTEFQEAFDIVHVRSVIGHLLDPGAGLRTITGCVKPNGLLLFADGDCRIYDSKKHLLQAAIDGEDNTDRSWFAKWQEEWIKQTCPNGHYSIEERVENLKQDSRIEASGVIHRQYFAPVNWPGEGLENGEELGQIMKLNLTRFVEACRPSFLASGYELETVNRWIGEIKKEMDGPVLRYYVTWHVISAFRTEE